MSKSLAVVTALLLLLSLQSLSLAAGPNNPAKWSQMPDMVRGFEFATEAKVPAIVADDWVCPDGKPITDIHWWGGYWTPVAAGRYGSYADGRPTLASPGTLQGFTINIWSNVPQGGSEPYSRPGSILKSYTFGAADVHESLYGTTGAGKIVYQYYVDLPVNDRFDQVQGTTYWLSIQADLPSNIVQWGWHESSGPHASISVQDFRDSGWLLIQNNQYDNGMAFELTTVPEPAGLSLLGVGLSGMASLLFRRRK